MPDFSRYFGIMPNSSEYIVLVETLHVSSETPVVKKFGKSTEYHCFYEHGIALCFEGNILDSIDFYKQDRTVYSTRPETGGGTVDKKPTYKKVAKSAIPDFIDYTATGLDLVNKFGEPLEKGGGMSKKMDIWMRWTGFQVDIPDRSWETAKDCEWSSLTIYKE